MVRVGETVRVQGLQVGCEIMYPLSIKELSSAFTSRVTCLADDVGWLEVAQRLDELVHRPVKVALVVKVIAVPLMYLGDTWSIHTGIVGYSDRQCEQVLAVESIELGLNELLVQAG